MKILIIQTAFIGDVVLATPLIEKLKAYYPGSKIDFLLRKGNEGLLKNHPKLNKVLVFDKKQKYKNLRLLIKSIRAEGYDHVINVQRFFTTGLITALSNGKQTVGFDKNPLSIVFSNRVKHLIAGEMHEVERNLMLIEHLTDTKFQRPVLYPSQKDEEAVPVGTDYVCMAPASQWFTKQWPAEKWITLIKQMPGNSPIYLIGSPQDMALCEQIQQATDKERVHIMAGKLNLLESVALIKHARMTYSNDSAPLHFASAVNAPATALFCSTIPAFGFGPLSDDARVVETDQKLPCRPCGLHGKKACPEGHFRCADIPIKKLLQETELTQSVYSSQEMLNTI